MQAPRLLAAIGVVAFAACTAPTSPTPVPIDEPDRGAALYTRHCAVCHGQEGNGDTLVADLLLPRPTAFRQGLFKLVSTTNGMPTERDLVETLRRGMPGSTMMSWGWMPDSDLEALAREVRELAVRGRAESMHRTAAIANRPMTAAQATEAAERQLQPGSAIDVGTLMPATAANLAEGQRLYHRHCASCHGDDGRGLPAVQGWPTDGTWLWPRDFTSGYLRGGSSYEDLALRVRAGMPGARMPPTPLSTPETEALVTYVRSLIPEAAGDHHAQWRRTIRVPRVATLPADDFGFAQLDEVRLPVAPLWCRPEACSEVWLRAAHDGDEFVVQLEWADATQDDRARPAVSMGDGAAIEFARAEDPPLFAMGSPEQPVNVWHWHAFDAKQMAGMADLLSQPHRGLDAATASLQPPPRMESISVPGLHAVGAETGSGLPLRITPRWHDGHWTVTFRRFLRARSEREVDLELPGPVLFALAIWDGSLDEHAGSKSITTWHVLELER